MQDCLCSYTPKSSRVCQSSLILEPSFSILKEGIFCVYSFPRLETLPVPGACPVLERLKEGVFVASEGPVDFGSAQGLRVESYTWHRSSAEIEAGFQHLNLLHYFFSHF